MTQTQSDRGKILIDEPLAAYTTWRVGGLAKKLYRPAHVDDLGLFLKETPKTESIVFLGLGSNSLIRDSGFSGTVVLTQGCLMGIDLLDEQTIRVEAGVSCATMARFCARNHLEGGEFLAGIPGTMGGALRMNAGCAGGETWNLVQEVETVNRKGLRRIRKADSFDIGYRQALGLEDDEYFVAGTLRFQKGVKEQSLARIKELLAHRANTQPTSEYNCGSVFRNPTGDFAARLIESIGLKGHQLGGAVVSQKHANFIINQGGVATAKDIESLIALVQNRVYEKTQIKLIREVHIIGDE